MLAEAARAFIKAATSVNEETLKIAFLTTRPAALAAAAVLFAATGDAAFAQKKYDTGVTDAEIKIGNVEASTLIPGIKINTSATDYAPIEQLQMMRFKGGKWELFGDIISAEQGN
jgi:hypothetical protein